MVKNIDISNINSDWLKCDIYFEDVATDKTFKGVLNEFYVFDKFSIHPTFLKNYSKEEKIKLYEAIFSVISDFMSLNNVDYLFFNIKPQIPFEKRMKTYRRYFLDCTFYTKYNGSDDITDVYMVKNQICDKFEKKYEYEKFIFEHIFTSLEDFFLFGNK